MNGAHLAICLHVHVNHLCPGHEKDRQGVLLCLVKQVLEWRLEGAVDLAPHLVATADVTITAHNNVTGIDHLKSMQIDQLNSTEGGRLSFFT